MDNLESGAVCIPNINAQQRRRRLVGGLVMLALALVVLMGLVALGANAWWRVALFPLFFAAASGYFQWRDRT